MGAEVMKTRFLLDTNVILRFLITEQSPQKQKAIEWFQEAENGHRSIIVTPLVVAEASFVLESYYKADRKVIADQLEVFVSQRWLQVEERPVLQKLWNDYREGLHFVDSYLRARSVLDERELLTFDRQMLKK
ncbi:MAG: hypothetical protein A3H42_01285 [Deltaproteobacteria bacterium RIFCSPLOWO2_02_FULL_46_8]|nr:MAG: hypothetical protein A3H42_01285 [Deltaproteobacteria bacterium RIFCSPLOWO2_02_FULL_46_8]